MSNIDVSRLKAELSELARHRKHPDSRGKDRFERAQKLANRRALAQALEQFFTKAGIDGAELNKILAKDEAELRRTLDKQRAQKARSSSAKDALRHGIEGRRQALE